MLKDIINKDSKLSDYAHVILLIFVFLIPFNSYFNTYIFGIFIVLTLFDKNFYQRFLNTSGFKKYIFLLTALLFLILSLSLLHPGDMKNGLKMLSPRIFLGIIPLLFLGLSFNQKQIKRIFISFILGVLVSSLICIITILIQRTEFTDNGIIINYAIYIRRDYMDGFFESLVKRNNYFSYSHLSLFSHPTYYSLYILLSVSVLYIYLRSSIKIVKMKILISIVIIYFLIFLIFLSVRASFFTLIFIFIALIFYEAYQLKRKIIPFSLILVLVILSIYFFQTKTVSKSINSALNVIENGFDPEKEYDARIYIWYSSAKAIKKAPIFGVGIANSKDVLNKSLKETKFEKGFDLGYNSHNQFLDIWLETGIFGFVIFLGLFMLLFVYSVRKKEILLFIFSGIIFLNLMFESVLNRFAGVLFFTFFLGIILNTNKKEKKIISDTD